MTKKNLSSDKLLEELEKIPDEVLERIQFSVPWQYSDVTHETDEDGFPVVGGDIKDDTAGQRSHLQSTCFKKFHRNPHVNTSVRGLVGRLTGFGFETTSEIPEIRDVIEEIELDARNRLWYHWPKFVGRYNIEGELFLILTLHRDGFVEVDFLDPVMITGGGDNGSGIIFHPDKPTMPLFYVISQNLTKKRLIPSIYVGRYPELVSKAAESGDYKSRLTSKSKGRGKTFRPLGGFQQFVIANDKGILTRRAISYLRTTLEWLNHYENLKKYEIDHKKSSGAYTWVFSFEDVRAFRVWLSLSDEEKRKTAVGSKMTPGSKLVLPPGMTVEAKNPNLTSIKDQDTDILHMIAGGLNEPEDILTGAARGPFSSVKASRGPMSDRTSDEIAYFERWLKYEFWASIFFLKAAIGKFEPTITKKDCIGFNDNQEPQFRDKPIRPEQAVDISFPISEAQAFEERARALLGVKHGPMAETLGIPNQKLARLMGFGGYGRARQLKALEDEMYPELAYEMGVDAESQQETVEGEPGKQKKLKMIKRQK